MMEIEPMTPADVDEARALWTGMEGIGLSDADEPQALARYLARNPGVSVVAREGGVLVGTALCGHDGRRGYLHHLAVAPTHRRRGIGEALVERCLAALRAEGIAKCHLFVYADNEAGQAFWTRVGWERRDDVLMMSRNLSACAASCAC